MRFKEAVYTKYRVLAEGIETLYHGSRDPNLTKVEEEYMHWLDFGGIFASSDSDVALSHGKHLYQIELGRLIIDEKSLYKLSSWIDFRDFSDAEDIEDLAAYEIERALEERIIALFGKDDLGEVGWAIQSIRGKIAKKLGYKAVSTEDEHGTSYLVLPGVKLTRLTERPYDV